MERTSIKQVKELFGKNFIGMDELTPLAYKMDLSIENMVVVPEIKFSLEKLNACCKDYILILGISRIGNKDLSIASFREVFGVDPEKQEPCFYNQDWYLKEDFTKITLENRWYLLKKGIIEESRGIQPGELLKQHILFPSAILCIYTFFAYYFARKELLWYHDFVWCSDIDHSGDQIYVGKYHDIDGINKNGFNIHRYLTLKRFYCSINVQKE